MKITVATKLYGVIGDPIAQSLSPTLHNHLFKNYQIDGVYFPIQIQSSDLEALMTGFRLLNVGGFNVTKPHKESIINYLDHLDPLAEKIGAVNTVVCAKGNMTGYNTDGYGFIKSLSATAFNKPKQALTVLLLGAGGAVKSIAMALADWGVQRIIIANRTVEKAEKLCTQINDYWPAKAQAIPLAALKRSCEEADLIVNGTSLGMADQISQSPLDGNFFRPEHFVYDLIYSPSQTHFLKAAQEKGSLTQNGLDMLLYQGLLAFEHWTGILPDPKLGKTFLRKGLHHEKES